jgi:hypothetical protein
MDNDTFAFVFDEFMSNCHSTLVLKGKEYATDDRLHNFKVAANTIGCTPKQALGGFMAKHIVSIYDMIRNDQQYSISQWDEKIGDAVNYLILLKAIVEEERENLR